MGIAFIDTEIVSRNKCHFIVEKELPHKVTESIRLILPYANKIVFRHAVTQKKSHFLFIIHRITRYFLYRVYSTNFLCTCLIGLQIDVKRETKSEGKANSAVLV